MKVLQINAVNKLSSTGRNVYELSEYLNNNGNSCVVAFSKGPSVTPENEFKIGNRIDVKIHGLLSRILGKQGYFSKNATRKLLKFMTKYKPDAVVLNNLHGNYINLPMLLRYLSKKNIATIAVLHDCWFYTGRCCHYTTDNCYKWQEKCKDCPSLKKYNVSWFFDRTSKMQKDKIELFGSIPRLAVVGVSEWITNEAIKSPVFKNAKEFKRIYNWIDTNTFKPCDTKKEREKFGLKDKKVILSVANGWNKEKGLNTILELSYKLSADERIMLVGNIPEYIELNEKIIHIPTTNSIQELVVYYSMADVFLQPSLEETFGKVTAEALSCGTPVVCFNSTANPELVGDGCGAAIDVGNTSALLKEIRNIMSLGKEMFSNKCRSFAEQNFSITTSLDGYLSLIEKMKEVDE